MSSPVRRLVNFFDRHLGTGERRTLALVPLCEQFSRRCSTDYTWMRHACTRRDLSDLRGSK